MSRASRARRIAAAAAFGGGGLTALGALGVGVVAGQARLARRQIGQPFGVHGPPADGIYGAGPGEPLDLAVLGDSTAAGLGADSPAQTPAAILATGLAALSGRPVRLTNVAVVGSESAGLASQVDELFETVEHLDVAVIMVGGNDVTHRVKPPTAVRHLTDAVYRLRERGGEVVVGTCPDLGTVQPIAQPLRALARRLSRELAAAQTIAVVEAGGRTVSLGDVLGPEFAAAPAELFSVDRFHPSAAGYARLASALLPSVCAAVGFWPDGGTERAPERRRGEGVAPVAEAAVAAADRPGTEVAAVRVGGSDRGQGGRWAMLLRRRRQPLPAVEDSATGEAASPDAAGSAGDGTTTGDRATSSGTADAPTPPDAADQTAVPAAGATPGTTAAADTDPAPQDDTTPGGGSRAAAPPPAREPGPVDVTEVTEVTGATTGTSRTAQ